MRPDPVSSTLLSRRRHPGQTRLAVGAACAAAALVAAGCSSGNGAMSPVSGTITIAAAPGIDDAPLYLAQQQGLFAAAGLHVKLVNFGSPTEELTAIEDGKAQIAASDYGNIFAFQAGKPTSSLHILADGYDAGSADVEILTSPTSGIVSPASLQSVPIGVPSDSIIPSLASSDGVPRSLISAAASAVISNSLASPARASFLTWKPMPQQQEVTELQDGKLKAALLTEPYIYEAETRFGAGELLDAFSGETAGLPLSGYVATSAWVTSNQAAVADFKSAIAQAQAAGSMTGPVQRSLTKWAQLPAQTAAMVSLGTYPTTTSANALTRVALMMSDDDMLKAGASISIRQMLPTN
jgi:ABC-type nitrate/sulfonate/bicarbonate transport system substrate-binding protein